MTSIRAVPRERWSQQPIQPTAGSYWLRCKRIIKLVLVMLAAGVAFAIVTSGIHPKPWWILWVPLTFFLLSCLYLVVVGAFALRPYRAERRLGYTTWPSGEEIKTYKGKRPR
jgi:membrane protein YdbS with pleckstrin-like domain